MTLLFTPEELIQYLYKETSPDRTAQIEEMLQSDWSLREKLEVLQKSIDVLNRPLESPRTEAVLNVLNYAREAVAESIQQH
jgi:flagellin-specific chaperone FliS